MELFEAEMPKAVGLLRAMAEGTLPNSTHIAGGMGKRRFFSGLSLYRVSAGFIAHSTNAVFDMVAKELPRSTIELSGQPFRQPFLVGMTSTFQLFITTQPTPWMNGHHLVVGKVIDTDARTKINRIGLAKSSDVITLHDMLIEGRRAS